MKPFQPVAPSFDLLNEALAALLPSDGGNGTALSGRQAASPSTEQLLASRDAILDQLPAPLVISDDQDHILYINRALLSLTNCPEDFLQGKKLSSILIPRAKLDPQSEDAQDLGGPLAAGGLVEAGPPDGGRAPPSWTGRSSGRPTCRPRWSRRPPER